MLDPASQTIQPGNPNALATRLLKQYRRLDQALALLQLLGNEDNGEHVSPSKWKLSLSRHLAAAKGDIDADVTWEKTLLFGWTVRTWTTHAPSISSV